MLRCFGLLVEPCCVLSVGQHLCGGDCAIGACEAIVGRKSKELRVLRAVKFAELPLREHPDRLIGVKVIDHSVAAFHLFSTREKVAVAERNVEVA